jgi:hypothetical protein
MINLEKRLQELTQKIIETTEFINKHCITKIKCKNCLECKYADTCLQKDK